MSFRRSLVFRSSWIEQRSFYESRSAAPVVQWLFICATIEYQGSGPAVVSRPYPVPQCVPSLFSYGGLGLEHVTVPVGTSFDNKNIWAETTQAPSTEYNNQLHLWCSIRVRGGGFQISKVGFSGQCYLNDNFACIENFSFVHS